MPTITYYCSVCGEPNETFVDESACASQQYTEDCQVCCRPNVLRIHIVEETHDVIIEAEFDE